MTYWLQQMWSVRLQADDRKRVRITTGKELGFERSM
jgi:hypothetical protein